MSKAHAEHNEELCDFLIKDGKYTDWIITTAFYSALHYVQNELFPMNESSIDYNTYNSYFNANLKKKKFNKHSGMIMLTGKNLSPCLKQYRWLFDACMNSRYNNYKVSEAKAKTAKLKLEELKQHLTK